MTAKFADKIKLNCAVREVEKKGTKIQITDQNGEKYLFDRVIFANHANQILQMHQNPDPEMKRVLSKFKFKQNLAVLHRDESLMPKSKAAWASWIYLREEGGDDSRCNVTYYMNELQDIDKKYPLFVTLNPQKEIAKDKIFASFEYQHPTFDTESIKAQEQIQELQGLNGFYYAGAYLANGFHEDGVNSAIKVAKLFDAKTI